MSEEELRKRIARAIMSPLTDRMGYVDGPIDGSEVIQVDGFVDPREIAQAVINDLGLTVETSNHGWCLVCVERGLTKPAECRVVGGWEEV